MYYKKTKMFLYVWPNIGFGDLVKKYLGLRRKCDRFHGENHFKMYV